jgi:hypothetical protein
MKYPVRNSTGQSYNTNHRKTISFAVCLGTAFIMLCVSTGLWISWKSTQKDCYDSCMAYGLVQFISGIITTFIGVTCLISALIIGICLLCQKQRIKSIVYK